MLDRTGTQLGVTRELTSGHHSWGLSPIRRPPVNLPFTVVSYVATTLHRRHPQRHSPPPRDHHASVIRFAGVSTAPPWLAPPADTALPPNAAPSGDSGAVENRGDASPLSFLTLSPSPAPTTITRDASLIPPPPPFSDLSLSLSLHRSFSSSSPIIPFLLLLRFLISLILFYSFSPSPHNPTDLA